MSSMIEPALRVMEVERFATRDGPGIRTTVFLKGCPLHCPWCANPESQRPEPQLLWFEGRCTACGACVSACSRGARAITSGEKPLMDRALCAVCGACVHACGQNALRLCGEERTPSDLLAEVVRDKDYYEASGGGVTVSGGEPFAQALGLGAFLDLCKSAGLSTAVETCGAFSAEAWDTCPTKPDLFLFDVKHADEARLRAVTGGDLPLIRQNLARAVASGAKVVARVPVIPGFNHDETSMRGIFQLVGSCGVGQVDLLPYHTLGKNKYAALGLQYAMGDGPMLHEQDLLPWQQIARDMGFAASTGG